jgi:hypothetical protein
MHHNFRLPLPQIYAPTWGSYFVPVPYLRFDSKCHIRAKMASKKCHIDTELEIFFMHGGKLVSRELVSVARG